MGYAFDVTDRTQLAGFADHVFVGTVIGIARTDDTGHGARTMFWVRVEQAPKGGATGVVTVGQPGGRIGGDTWRVEGQDLLTVARTYLLVTTAPNPRSVPLSAGDERSRIEEM